MTGINYHRHQAAEEEKKPFLSRVKSVIRDNDAFFISATFFVGAVLIILIFA